jgi:beta-lactamase class A
MKKIDKETYEEHNTVTRLNSSLEDLCAKLEKIIDGINADVSVLWQPLDFEKPTFEYHSEKRMVSASIIKVPLMLAVLDKLTREADVNNALSFELDIRKGDFLDDTEVFTDEERAAGTRASIEKLITWAIIKSDNTSTNVLIDYIGMDAVNEYCLNLGLKETLLQRKMLDFDAITRGQNNYTSATDMFIVFKAIYNKEILTPRLCELALHILTKQRDYSLLPRLIWEDATFAHKTGGLDYLSHDAGIIIANDVAYYLAYFAQNADKIEGRDAEGALISRLIFEYMSP